MSTSTMELRLKGYRLATAEIVYRMPDHPDLLQTFVWQLYDIAPHFPRLRRFLRYWEENLDGPIHSVRVGRSEILKAPDYHAPAGLFQLH